MLNSETTDALLTQIRDLLIPIADHFQEEYEVRQRVREEATRLKVVEILSTAPRRRAWELADSTRTQREIAKQSGLDEGTTSKMFKALRELGALDGTNPTRTMEIK